jgi:hypothetical protein
VRIGGAIWKGKEKPYPAHTLPDLALAFNTQLQLKMAEGKLMKLPSSSTAIAPRSHAAAQMQKKTPTSPTNLGAAPFAAGQTLRVSDFQRLMKRPQGETPTFNDQEAAKAAAGERIEKFDYSATEQRGLSENAPLEGTKRALGVASVPDGAQFAVATTADGTSARLLVPEGRLAGVELWFRTEGKKLRVRADGADRSGEDYLKSICDRLRHRGYDAEVEDA